MPKEAPLEVWDWTLLNSGITNFRKIGWNVCCVTPIQTNEWKPGHWAFFLAILTFIMQAIPRPFASLQQRYSNKIKLHIDTRQLHFSPEFLWGKLADLLVCAFFISFYFRVWVFICFNSTWWASWFSASTFFVLGNESARWHRHMSIKRDKQKTPTWFLLTENTSPL